MSSKQTWTFVGIDLGAGDDSHAEVEVSVGADGKVVRKITQLYGRPGNIRFADGKPTIDLEKGKDGQWR